MVRVSMRDISAILLRYDMRKVFIINYCPLFAYSLSKALQQRHPTGTDPIMRTPGV